MPPGEDPIEDPLTEAVRAGAGGPPPPTPPPPTRRPAASRRAGAPRALQAVVFVLVVLLAASLGGFAVVHLAPDWLSSVRNPHPSAVPTSSTPASSSSSSSSSTVLALGPGPVLSSIAPSEGGPGATVTLLGRRLFSSDQVIRVTFGPTVTADHCPTEQECIATVPPAPRGSSAVAVRVRTSSGLSNPVTFTYR